MFSHTTKKVVKLPNRLPVFSQLVRRDGAFGIVA